RSCAVGDDPYYALADREDDLKIGVRSTAILFGAADRLIIFSLQCLSLVCLLLAGARFELGLYFHLGLAVALLCFLWEFHRTRNQIGRASCRERVKMPEVAGRAKKSGA